MEPDLNKMKVKVLFLSLLMCGTLAACGSDDDEMSYVTTDPFLNQNNITDVACLYWDIAVDENTVLYWGNRKDKEWFALFDKGNGALLKEWYGKEQVIHNDNSSFTYTSDISVKRFKSNTIAILSGGELVLLHENQKVEYCTFMDGTSYLIKGIISEDRCLCSNGNIQSIFDFKGNMIAEDVYAWEEVYMGFQDNKLWAGYCDANGDFKEMRTLDDFERDRTYHMGYDEYKRLHIDAVVHMTVQKNGYGCAILPDYYDDNNMMGFLCDVLFLNEKDGIIYVHPLSSDEYEYYGTSLSLDDWYEDSFVLWHGYGSSSCSLSVFTMKGEKIVDRVNLRCSIDNIYGVYGIYPIAYDEAICFFRIGGVSALRNNFSSETTIWSTGVEKLNKVPSDARITFTLKEKNAQSWLVQCDVVNRDGSKSEFSFHLNIETGEIQYVS